MKYGIPNMKLNKSLLILLLSIMILHIGIYMITPILPIIFKADKKINAAQIGLIIGAGSFAVQLGSLLGGILSDRLGKKTSMMIGSLFQAAAMFGYSFTSSFVMLLGFSVVNGTGGGIYAPAIRAAIASIASESAETRTTAFSLRGIAASAGISIGGLLTLMLSRASSRIVFTTASIIFLALAILTWVLLPKDCGGEDCPVVPLNSYKLIFKNKPFMIFTAVSILISAVYSLLTLLLPLRAEAVLENSKAIGTIWTITSILLIIFQSFVSKYVLQTVSPFTSLFWSLIFFSGGIFLIGLSYSFIFLTLSAVVFLAGEMLMLPTTDSLTSQLAQTELLGAYFSVSSLIGGIGAALGNFVGGELINYYGINSTLFPWFIFSAAALITALLIFMVKKLPQMKSIAK